MKLKSFQNFLSLEILGGLLLLVATILALLLKNNPYGEHYMHFLSVEMGLKLELGSFLNLRFYGLMMA